MEGLRLLEQLIEECGATTADLSPPSLRGGPSTASNVHGTARPNPNAIPDCLEAPHRSGGAQGTTAAMSNNNASTITIGRKAAPSPILRAQSSASTTRSHTGSNMSGKQHSGRLSPLQNSSMRGALLLGKAENTIGKRYYGKGFAMAAVEDTPGLIYNPPIHGFNSEGVGGKSFTKQIRQTLGQATENSGITEMLLLPGSLGKQPNSNYRSASNASFSRSVRVNQKLHISRVHHDSYGADSPGPVAYQAVCAGTTNDGRGAPLLGNREAAQKMFISKGHSAVDGVGMESPGPIYSAMDGLEAAELAKRKAASSRAGSATANNRSTSSASQRHSDAASAKRHIAINPFHTVGSAHRSGPSFSMTGTRSASAPLVMDADVAQSNCSCHFEKDEQTHKCKRSCLNASVKPGSISQYVPAEPFISRLHSKTQSTSNTPGPAFYNPIESFNTVNKGTSVAFGKSKKSDGAEAVVAASPGPKYNPVAESISKHVSTYNFGSRHPHEDRSDRFSTKQYLGSGFDTGDRSASPGPIYTPKDLTPAIAPGASMAFRDPDVSHKKLLFPGPLKNRYLSKESARENFGAYSPGPKYDIRGDISKEALAFSIPLTERLAGKVAKPGAGPLGGLGTNHAAGGDAGIDAVGGAGGAGGGSGFNNTSTSPKNKERKPTLLYPKDTYLSTSTYGPSVGIAPLPASPERTRPDSPGGGGNTPNNNNKSGGPGEGGEGASPNRSREQPLVLTEPVFHLVEQRATAACFSKTARLPPQRGGVQPGPAQYAPNYAQVERHTPAFSIGLM